MKGDKVMNRRTWFGVVCLLAAMALGVANVPAAEKINTEPKQQLPRPDAKAPDMTKPVKVFILMGQSNMVGMGEIGPETTKGTLAYLTKKEGKYPWLVDDGGNWTVRKDVYYYDARTKMGSPFSPTSNNGRTIGPELGFGYVMGHVLDEPVLVLKSCIGNRSLGWDLLPPGSERFTYEGRTYAGYKDTPDSWIEGQPKKEVNWYAGKQYDTDTADAKEVLNNLAKCCPDYKGQGYEVAGFVFWQGHKDQNPAHASRYEQNLVRFINCLRKDFDAPKAPFVLATIAFGGWKLAGPGLTVANAQLAVSGEKGKYPEFAGNVKTVEARDFWRDVEVSPKNQGYHYNRNAETYMEVGNALGWAMADLLKNKK
jgi:alpha-galactosidase